MHICIHTHTHTHTHTHIERERESARQRCVCRYIYAGLPANAGGDDVPGEEILLYSMYANIYIFIGVNIYTYIYIYIFIHTHTHILRESASERCLWKYI